MRILSALVCLFSAQVREPFVPARRAQRFVQQRPVRRGINAPYEGLAIVEALVWSV